MMPGGCCGGSNGMLALLDLALGYIVCYLASQLKAGLLKKVGYLIGVAIIVISGLMVAGKVMFMAKHCCAKTCPMMSSMNMPSAPDMPMPKK
jgi:hypothetical protein